VALALSLAAAVSRAQSGEPSARANELSLAGLRPGRETLNDAFRRYKRKYLWADAGNTNSMEWRDPCTGRALTVEIDDRSLIQEVTISSLVPPEGKCDDRRFESLNLKDWITGHGLRIGDSRDRVVELYGEPRSSGPVVKEDHELELLEFSFDWAGREVPQAMRIYCARDTGRVVEMTLARTGSSRAKQDH